MPSVRWQVVEATLAAIQGLALPASPTSGGQTLQPTQVVIRKKAEHDTGFEQQPGIVLVSNKERFEAQMFTNKVLALYDVLVLLVLVRSLRPEWVQYEADTRELIRLALWKPYVLTLSSGAKQEDAQYDPDPPVSVASWGDVYDVTAQMFTFRVTEARSS